MKQVKKLSLKRKPSTYGSSVLPLNLVPSKDRATPLRPTLNASNAMYNRLSRRKERGAVTITRSFFMNDACRMKLRSKLPSDRRLRTIYNHVHDSRSTSTGGAVQPAGLDLVRVYCQVCGATASKYCHCGAECVPNSRLVELKAFMGFVKSPRNPLLHFGDPDDQRGVMNVLKTLGAHSAKEFFRVLFIIAMVSNEAVLQEIGKDIQTRRIDYLDKLFKQRRKDHKSTFRAGQFAGVVKVDDLAHALDEYCQKCLRKVTPFLTAWKEAKTDRQRCVVQVRNILELHEEATVFGFGTYKRKKFAEFLVLAGMANVYGVHFEEQWLNSLSDIWPIPDNSLANLKRIFPDIHKPRAGIVALMRGLRHSGFHTFATVVAQLCFWGEQRNGRINWL